MLLVAEVLVEEEMVLAVSGPLVKKGTIPHESVILDKEERVVLSSDALVVIWYSWGLSFWLGWTRGHRHLFEHFWVLPICSLLLQQ